MTTTGKKIGGLAPICLFWAVFIGAVVAGVWLFAGQASAQENTQGAAVEEADNEFFSPDVTILIPQIDENGDGVNDFAGTEYQVAYSATTSPDFGCNTASETYITKNSGTVILQSEPAQLRTFVTSYPSDPSMVGILECRYRETVDSLPTGLHYSLPEQSGSIRFSNRSRVIPLVTIFKASITVSLPYIDSDRNGYHDLNPLPFRIRVVSSAGINDSVCHHINTVRTGGSRYAIGLIPGSPQTVNIVSLIDIPEGKNSQCNYVASVGFDNNDVTEKISENIELTPEYNYNILNSESNSIVANFILTDEAVELQPDYFTVEIDFEIPLDDEDNDGVNDYAGEELRIEYSSTDSGACTDEAYNTYIIHDDGSVMPSEPLVSLISQKVDGSDCRYVFERVGRLGGLLSHSSSLMGSTGVARTSYFGSGEAENGQFVIYEEYVRDAYPEYFSPNVDIRIGTYGSDGIYSNGIGLADASSFAGLKLVLEYHSGPIRRFEGMIYHDCMDRRLIAARCRPGGYEQNQEGCTNFASETYVVRDDGSVALDGPAASLKRSTADTFCSYLLWFPDSWGDKLIIFGNGESWEEYNTVYTTLSDDAPSQVFFIDYYYAELATVSAVAIYVPTLLSNPEPAIFHGIPRRDMNQDGIDDYSGTKIVLSYSAADHHGCSEGVTETYVVQDNGSIIRKSLPAELVTFVYRTDRTGLRTREYRRQACGYKVTAFPFYTTKYLGGGTCYAELPSIKDLLNATVEYGYFVSYGSVKITYGLSAGNIPAVQTSSGPICNPVLERPAESDMPDEVADSDSGVPEDSAGGDVQPGPQENAPQNSQSGGGSQSGSQPGSQSGSSGGSQPGTQTGGSVQPGLQSGSGAQSGAGSGSVTQPGSTPPAVPSVGLLELPSGWVVLPFNGPSGMLPGDFAEAMDGSLESLWVWDGTGQRWRGWMSDSSSGDLAGLEPGDAVMAYSPVAVEVSYSPADLLEPTEPAAGSLSVPVGYSLQVFGGDSSATLESLFGSEPSSVLVVFRWDVSSQNWDYYLPGRQPVAGLDIDWFDTIDPGDAVFVFNASSEAATISWQ